MIDLLVVLFRLLTFGSIAVLGGGLLFLALAWRNGTRSSRMQKVLRYSLFVAFGATAGTLLVHGPDVLDRSVTAVSDLQLLKTAAGTTFGNTVVARLVVLAVVGLLIARGLRQPLTSLRKMLAVALLVPTLVATQSFSGHAAEKGSLVLALDMAHLVAASVWLGGLVVLVFVLLPTQRRDELAVAVPAFSKMAFTSVVILAVTGGIHALVRVGSIGAFFTHSYGQLILLKLAIFVVLVVCGGLSHRWVQRRFAQKAGTEVSDKEFRKGIRRTAGTEVGIGVAVLLVTAILVATNPPATAAEHSGDSAENSTHG